ncbi:TPA: hypothetical protein ACUP1N_005199, partial [Escherichia coli]
NVDIAFDQSASCAVSNINLVVS